MGVPISTVPLEPERENVYDYSANVNLSFIPYNLRYVLIMPFDSK
jgi:hypothetical protein